MVQPYAPLFPLDSHADRPCSTEDLAVMRYYYKQAREIGRRMASFRGEYAPDHPDFPPGSSAALLGPPCMAQPVAMDASDIVYTKEDDEAIDKMLKANGTFSETPQWSTRLD